MAAEVQIAVAQPVLEVFDSVTQALVPITKETFLRDWALPAVQRRFDNHNSPLACLNSKTSTIGEIKRSFGTDFIEAYIEGWIINLRMFLSVGKAMTDDQTHETAMMIVSMHPNLNIADINLIFKNIKSGRAGKIYDRLDGNVLLEIFDKYFDERCEEAAQQSMREADSMRFPAHDTPERIRKIVDSAMPKDKYGK